MTLTLAIPTGRIFEETKSLLSRCGMSVSDEALTNRKLRIAAKGCTLVLAKDRDVATYVEHGVADAGIVGKDVLVEQAPDIYEPLDLGVGRCRMVVARPRQSGGKPYRERSVVRVATKYPRVATTHFHQDGIPVEVIPLSGSVELAPLLGLSDVIVDVVQTGRTLEANGLEIEEVLFVSTARLIVNRASFRLENDAVRGLVRRLEEGVRA